MSASTSHKTAAEALESIRGGPRLSRETVRRLGEENGDEFFRVIVEGLSDSFDPKQIRLYEHLMRVWIPETPRITPVIPACVERVYVLSRVTLGSDIKITSIILDAMKRRFPDTAITLVGGSKSAELFAADPHITHLEAAYPRSGPVSSRLDFARDLAASLDAPSRIVVDPDTRITQLGLQPVCEPEHYFHFPSRTAGPEGNLTELTQGWVSDMFGVGGEAYIAPRPAAFEGDHPAGAISLGVGGNDSKRLAGDFEPHLIRAVSERYRTLWIDRGAGGEEAVRVTAAVEQSGAADRVRFWEGSFAGFASIISQCDLYCGYDSAGQHAAAAAGTPLISFFFGAPSSLFAERWAPRGPGPSRVIMESEWTLESLRSMLAAGSS